MKRLLHIRTTLIDYSHPSTIGDGFPPTLQCVCPDTMISWSYAIRTLVSFTPAFPNIFPTISDPSIATPVTVVPEDMESWSGLVSVSVAIGLLKAPWW